MTAGTLKRLLTIQAPARADDGGGGFAVSWQDIETEPQVWAEIAEAAAAQELRQLQLSAAVYCRITLRWRGDITADMRLVDGDTVYTVMSLREPDGRGEWLEVTARKD